MFYFTVIHSLSVKIEKQRLSKLIVLECGCLVCKHESVLCVLRTFFSPGLFPGAVDSQQIMENHCHFENTNEGIHQLSHVL